jgi:tetratricopeptide (TPR) repeat protein
MRYTTVFHFPSSSRLAMNKPRNSIYRFLPVLLGFLAFLTVAVFYAQPNKDGDLWWQMVYGRWVLENPGFIPDHSIFTWTPALKDSVYCAWIGQVVLYLLYRAGGLPLLFALRYFCFTLFLVLMIRFAGKKKVLFHPLSWLIMITAILMCKSAAFIKPEIFSLVFFTLGAWNWWSLKQGGDSAWKRAWLFPILMLVWVNTHGVYFFGLAFVGFLFIGEILNGFFSKKDRLSPKARKHFLIAALSCIPAVCLNPYGCSYPLSQLLAYINPQKVEMGIAWFSSIHAYRPIFHPNALTFHYIDLFIAASLILVLLLWPRIRNKQVDWTVVIPNLAFGFLYTRFLRSTYLWAPVFAFSAIHLLASAPAWLRPSSGKSYRFSTIVIVFMCFFFSGRDMHTIITNPPAKCWFGFGICYQNPVHETEFIQKHFMGKKLGNDYGVGGYLMWKLWPEMKVFIDPRQFPFKQWFLEYRRDFTAGRDIPGFLQKYPAEVWCLRYRYSRPLMYFLRSPDWRLVFFGPVAAVFVRKDVEDAPQNATHVLPPIRNLEQSFKILKFLMQTGQFDTGKSMIREMKTRYRFFPARKNYVQAQEHCLLGFQALYEKRYREAIRHFEKASYKSRYTLDDNILIQCHLNLAVEQGRKGDMKTALEHTLKALELGPHNLSSLFNAGLIGYFFENNPRFSKIPAPGNPRWREHLKKFLALAKKQPKVPPQMKHIAGQMMQGIYRGPPVLVDPPSQELYTESGSSAEDPSHDVE